MITNDVVCHGVPSPKIWQDYISFLEKEYQSRVIGFRFRDKRIGWRGYNIRVEFEDKIIGNESATLSYAILFLQDVMQRPSCYYCPYNSICRTGDITIGDFWGVEKVMPDYSDNKGISMVFLNTEKGIKIFDLIKHSITIEECDMSNLTQMNLYAPTNILETYNSFWYDYFTGGYRKIAHKYGDYGLISKYYYLKTAVKYKLERILK